MNWRGENGLCPCGSKQCYSDCCARYINGKLLAPTAEALMRSRYSANVMLAESYLLQSWHLSTRPERMNLQSDSGHEWLGLEVKRCVAGTAGESEGSVEFIARYQFNGVEHRLHEVSRFCREQGQWFYLDGVIKTLPQCSEKSVGRNVPCPCGSGQKFKRCCG